MSTSFLIPCFISTALLGEKLLKTAITIFPTSVVHLYHFNEPFVSSTQQDLLFNSLFVSNPVPNPSYLGALILFILPSFWKNFLL